MELRQLKYFLKTQELLSFTEAAHSLHISQSTLSQQVKQLEIELDTPLFNRIGKQITLTEAGKLFIEFAEQSVRKAEEGKQIIRDLKNLHTGTITIGVAYGLRDFFVNALLDFAGEFSKVQIKVIYEPSHNLYDKLSQCKVDFVLAFHEAKPDMSFIYEELLSSSMVLVTSKKSVIANRKSISLQEICELPLVIATRGYNKNHTVYKAFREKKLNPEFSIEVNDISTTIELVRSGKWYSILVETSVSNTDLVSIPIKEDNLTRNAKIISLKDSYETKAIKEFKDRLFELAKRLNNR